MTDTHTHTLTAWLLDRIAEDEAAASNPPNTTVSGNGGWYYDQTIQRWCIESHTCDEYASPLLQIDPARVLRQCAAHRAIVELHEHQTFEFPDHETGLTTGCIICHSTFEDYAGGLCPTLRALATIYADAPGWREEWSL